MPGHWFPLDDSVRPHVPPAIWTWLAEVGSLTQRVKVGCAGEFELRVVDEHDGVLDAGDATTLGLAAGSAARFREVLLCCDGVPCIHARSILPSSTLAGAGRGLEALGTRPLGDALFAHPLMKRGPIEVTQCEDGAWGRRSVFRLDGEPLLVSEFFLPGLDACAR